MAGIVAMAVVVVLTTISSAIVAGAAGIAVVRAVIASTAGIAVVRAVIAGTAGIAVVRAVITGTWIIAMAVIAGLLVIAVVVGAPCVAIVRAVIVGAAILIIAAISGVGIVDMARIIAVAIIVVGHDSAVVRWRVAASSCWFGPVMAWVLLNIWSLHGDTSPAKRRY